MRKGCAKSPSGRKIRKKMRPSLVRGLSRKTTMKPPRLPVALALAALALPGLAAEKLRMDVQNTFTGPMADTTAMTVVLENDGPDVNGALVVSGEGTETTYPVELPRGARKKLLTLPTANYGELRFTLQTSGKDIVRTTMAVTSRYQKSWSWLSPAGGFQMR